MGNRLLLSAYWTNGERCLKLGRFGYQFFLFFLLLLENTFNLKQLLTIICNETRKFLHFLLVIEVGVIGGVIRCNDLVSHLLSFDGLSFWFSVMMEILIHF
jgi:hypothetical protein